MREHAGALGMLVAPGARGHCGSFRPLDLSPSPHTCARFVRRRGFAQNARRLAVWRKHWVELASGQRRLKTSRVRHAFRASSALALAALLVGCGGTDPASAGDDGESFTPRPITDTPGARRFVVLAEPGEVPGVADQPTERGRSIATLAPFGSHLYLGYGDFSDNTGPITDVSYDVERARFEAGEPLETEEVLDFQLHAGQLFIAELDPRGHEALGSVFRRGPGSSEKWHAMPDIPEAVHSFGMAEFGGELFVGTGSVEGGTARLAVTSDAGETWRDAHSTASPPGVFTRYTHLGTTSSELFVSGRIHGEPSAPFAYIWNGERWDAVSDLPSDGFLIPLVLDDQFFILQFSGDRGKGGHELGSYRITSPPATDSEPSRALVTQAPLLAEETCVNWSQAPVTDRTPTPPRTWVLTERSDGTQSVYLAESATDWQLVGELPSLPDADSFTSIAYLDDAVYLGTAHGGLCALEEIFELANGA